MKQNRVQLDPPLKSGTNGMIIQEQNLKNKNKTNQNKAKQLKQEFSK